MTPRELRNIHITRNTWEETVPCAIWQYNYPVIFTCWWRSFFVATCKFGLLAVKQHSAPRKHLLLVPQGDISCLRKSKRISTNTHHNYHQCSFLYVNLNWSHDSDSVLLTSIEKYSVHICNDVMKHLLHKVFLWYHHWKGG